MKKLMCWILNLSLLLSVLSLPSLSYPELASAEQPSAEQSVEPADLIELIQLQKLQLDDYYSKDQIRQEQIDQLNLSLKDCREDINKEIDTTARKKRWSSGGAVTGYLIGLVGIVFSSAVLIKR